MHRSPTAIGLNRSQFSAIQKEQLPYTLLACRLEICIAKQVCSHLQNGQALHFTQYNARKHIASAHLVSLLLAKDPQGSYLAGNQSLGLTSVGQA